MKRRLPNDDDCLSSFFDQLNDNRNLIPCEFSVTPEIFPFELPSKDLFEEFEISWLKPHSGAIFKQIKSNKYGSICKTTKANNDIPICSCDKVNGCNESCINRVLFM